MCAPIQHSSGTSHSDSVGQLFTTLPAVELAYNTTSHSSTKLSPFKIMIGENPITAADLDIVGALAPTLTPPMTKLFRQH